MEPFCHEILHSPRSIRLTRVLPSANLESEIEIEVFEINLDAYPPYEALSYTWGAHYGTESILCNARRFMVTPNCRSALQHLRGRLLWIDSICIDQSEHGLAERSVQVPLMGEIYSKATSTLCWLGPGLKYSPRLMHLLDKLGECPSERGVQKIIQFDENLSIEESCLDHIYCAPWHARVWTIQEVAFASRCEIIVGHSSIPWEHYSQAGKALLFERDLEKPNAANASSIVSIDIRDLLRECLSGDRNDKQALISCLTDANQFKATDPRDKIYGLYATYLALGVPLPSPDYAKTEVQVYTEAAAALIEWSDSLNLLKDACGIHRRHDLPSWVPDWGDGEIRLFLPDHGASTHGISSSARIVAPGRLLVQGVCLGRISQLHVAFPLDEEAIKLESQISTGDTLEGLINQIKFFRQLREHLSDDELFHDLISLDQAFGREDLWESWLDLLSYPRCDRDLSAERAMAEEWKSADKTENWSQETLNCAAIAASLLLDSSSGTEATIDEGLLSIVKETQHYLSRRTVASIRTSGSDYWGTVFCKSQQGDQIVYLEGLRWPAVLRRQGEAWTFIGPAIVIGMRDEEACHNDPPNDFVLV